MTKLKLTLFLITLSVFCFLPQFSFAYLDEFDFDDGEHYWNGREIKNFSVWADTNAPCKVSSSAEHISSPNSALCTPDPINYQLRAAYSSLNANPRNRVEFKYLTEKCENHNTMRQYGVAGSTWGPGAGFSLASDCKLSVRDGESWTFLQTIIPFNWYTLRLDPHPSDNSVAYAIYSYSTSTNENLLLANTNYLNQPTNWGPDNMTRFDMTFPGATTTIDNLTFGLPGEATTYETYSDPIDTQFTGLQIGWWETIASGTETYLDELGMELTGTIGTADTTSKTIRSNMKDNTGHSWITNATTTISDHDFLAGSDGLGRKFFIVIEPTSLMAPLGVFTFEFNFCNATGSDCGATTTYSLNINEYFIKIYPEKDYATWKAEQDILKTDPIHDFVWNAATKFINWLGLADKIEDLWNKIKAKFPFSWFFGIIDLWKAKETEYHDTGEEPFKVTLTIPTSTVVMAGTSFDIIDFEGAVRDYGGIISMFRNVFVYIIWLGLIMTVYKKTKVFVKQLQEED